MSRDEVQKKVRAAVQRLPHKERIRKIALFGSQLHEAAKADSDVDLLIEFTEPISFFQLHDLEEALKKAVGREVDVVTPEFLSQYFRDDVLREALTLYEG
jgi:predicted nucleotidyltransferase